MAKKSKRDLKKTWWHMSGKLDTDIKKDPNKAAKIAAARKIEEEKKKKKKPPPTP